MAGLGASLTSAVGQLRRAHRPRLSIRRAGRPVVASPARQALAAAAGPPDSSAPVGQKKPKQQQQQQKARPPKGDVGEADAGGRPPKVEGIYKDTVNLPVTAFDLRANAVVREPQLQAAWAADRVYERLLESAERRGAEPFTLHDGPPYANGDLHIGHALNKVLKDMINKFHMLRGRAVRFVPGWDCHGLPIELKVLQGLKPEERRSMGPLELRRTAASFATATVAAQAAQFQRYGVWGDFGAPYLTLSKGYEAAQVGVFGAMFLNGHIYRGRKPVHWSPSSHTALAEAELEYPEGHVSRSVYAAMPIAALPSALTADLRAAVVGAAGPAGAALAIWTTTAWTLPANLAVAINPQLPYAFVALPPDGAWPCVVAVSLLCCRSIGV